MQYFKPMHCPVYRRAHFLYLFFETLIINNIFKGGIVMNKKYQVFVSSTLKDLIDERQAIMQALLESKCIPAGMELFASANKKSWEIIKQDIDESDFYLLVIAGMYGSLTKDHLGNTISYTEKEYNYAVSIKKPIMVFMHGDINSLPSGKVEKSQAGKKRLEKFKQRLQSRIQVTFWTNIGELISKMKSSIQELIRTTSCAGWIKGTDLISEGITNDFVSKISNICDWGLERIFRTRAEKNAESDPKLENHNVKILDGIAFGLSAFRCNREYDVLECLQNGMNMRLLVMNPNSEFAKQRAIEENSSPDSIKNSIVELVKWVNKLNKKSTDGKIEIKFYNTMTLDFYWRIDNELYVGPYMYNIMSQQTITAKFSNGGKGFSLYTHYFENLWNNTELCEYPAAFIKVK